MTAQDEYRAALNHFYLNPNGPLPLPGVVLKGFLEELYGQDAVRDQEIMVRLTLAKVRAEERAEWPVFAGAWKAWAAGLAGIVGTALLDVTPQVITALESGAPVDLNLLGTLGRSFVIGVIVGLAAYFKRQGEPGPGPGPGPKP